MRIRRKTALLASLVIVLALVQACAPAPAAPLARTTSAQPAATTEAASAPEPTATTQPTAEATAVATAETTSRAEAGSDKGAGIAGQWEGVTMVAGQELITRMSLSTKADGLAGTVDFPQQNANGIPLDVVTFENGILHVEALPAPATAVFEGTLVDDMIKGTFEQAGAKGEFELTRVVKVLPYRAEEIEFKNGEVTLAGTLTLPEGTGPFPAVVLISGSGATNRDEELFGFKLFGVLADHLTRQGIAVLRYDDRGVGGSGGFSPDDTSETFAGDVAAGVAYLQGRPEVAADKIGLLGHSEGGMIALMVATGGVEGLAVQPGDSAFVVLMGGQGLPGKQVLIEQGEAIMKAGGASPEEIAKQTTARERLYQTALSGEGWDQAEVDVRQAYQDAAAQYTEEQRAAIGDVDQWVERMVAAQLQMMKSNWMKFFLSYDPAPALEEMKQPVLAVFGELDLQVVADANSKALEEALKRGGNQDYEIVVIPRANHLFQPAITGSNEEYPNLPAEFAPGFLDTVSSWILEHTK